MKKNKPQNHKQKWSRCLSIALIAIFMLSCNLFSLAQETKISGKVTSAEDGAAIPGVTVIVKGTSKGVLTDLDGKFSISIPKDAKTLQYTFVGMKPVEVTIGTSVNYDVVMQSEATNIEGVVITALGIKTEKKALGYATAQVNANQIGAVKAANNFVTALNGKVAGVQVSATSSQPGSGTRIIIRGGSSITGNNQPLFVVNGIPFDAANSGSSSGLADIDPNSIESLSILKGAAASALYGSQAANGVILVTLKSGSFDSKPVVSFSHSSSWEKIYEIPLQNKWAQGYWDGTNWVYVDGETSKTSQSFGPRIADVPGAVAYDRWNVFNTGYTGEYNLSVTGGNAQASYYVSYSNLNNQGVLDPMTFNRNTVNANTSFKFTKKLTVSSNMMYSKQRGNRLIEDISNSAFMNTLLASPQTWNPYPMRDDAGNLRLFRGGGRDPYLWVLESSGSEFQRDRFTGTVSVEYEILPFLKFRTVTGISTTTSNNNDHFNKGGIQVTEGYYNTYENFSRDVESNEMLTFDKKYGNFNITAMVGNNIVQNTWRGTTFTGTGLVIPDVYNTSNVTGYKASAVKESTYRSYSFFGEARVGYKNMLYYTLSGRNDHASSISNGYFYPSQSLGFIFSELLPNKNILSFGKLRASYAKVGAPAAAYVTNSVLSVAGGLGVKWPFNGQMSYLESSTYPNPLLTNEFKSEVEVGTELKFYKDRLGVDIAYYHNWSDNQIIWEQLLSSTGYTGGNINIGGITHKGFELSLYGTPVQKENFSWEIIANWSKDNSVVDKLGANDTPIDVGSSGTAIVGESYPVIYGIGFLRDDKGRLVLDDNAGSGLGSPQADNRGNINLGKISPDWIGSLRNTFKYKGLSLMAQIDFQKGGLMYSQNDHYLTYYGMAKHQENRPDDNMITFDGVMGHYDASTGKVVVTSETPVPTAYSLYYQTVCQQVTEDNIMPKDFIKLRELQLAYQLPKQFASKLYLKGLSVGFSGRNLWRKFKDGFEGPDTETNTNGIDNGNAYQTYSFPAVKTYTLSISANF
jgi:TonB-linked SusC/RagA family outer membrane protein